jgi:hypothetical protein
MPQRSRRRSNVKILPSGVRTRLSFANVTAALALFVALGGTGYAAATLPANSVGKSQIRTNAVGKSENRTNAVGKSEIRTNAVGKSEVATNGVGAAEVRTGAIGTNELRDGSITAADLSASARPARVGVTAAGAAVPGGDAKAVSRTADGTYTVDLGRDVSTCQYSATVAGVKNGTTIEQPGVGFATAAPGSANTQVIVRTFAAAGGPLNTPFHLLVAC